MKLLLQLLSLILNLIYKALLPVASQKTLDNFKPIPLCDVYGGYGINSPAFVGHNTAPSVSTGSASSITTTSFTQAGTIDSTGGANATVRGFAYMVGTSGDPTIANSVVNSSGSFGTGSYSLSISGLSSNTSYRVRAYATNSEGTGYGTSITVTTLSAVTYTQNNSAKASIRATETKAVSVKAALGNKIYSRGDNSTVPTTDANLETTYTSSEISDVGTDDGTRVEMNGSAVILHQFKVKHTNNTDPITPTWNGQSSVATTTNTVYLQIYNRNSSAWETLDSESATAADTDFTLTATQSDTPSNYYDANNWVSFRVYQA